MKARFTCFFVFVLMLTPVTNVFAATYVDIRDGLEHVDGTDYARKYVRLDYNVDNIPGTEVTFTGACRSIVKCYNHSSAVFDTEDRYSKVYAYGYSTVTVNNGSFYTLCVYDNAALRINGADDIGTMINISDNGCCELNGTFTIELYEDGFATGQIVTDVSSGSLRDLFDIGDGELSSDNRADFYVTGTLANGDVLDHVYVRFYEYGDIVIVPEPATLAFLGLGAFVLKRKKK